MDREPPKVLKMFMKEAQRPTNKGGEWSIPKSFSRALRPCQDDISCLKSLCHSGRTFASPRRLRKTMDKKHISEQPDR